MRCRWWASAATTLARRLESGSTSAVVNAALDEGINFLDTADVYGGTKSEEFLGGALGRHRDDVVIATKFGAPVDEKRKGATHSPEYVRPSCRGQPAPPQDRLYRPLPELHRPDPHVPIEDTLGALDELVRTGKVREIGCSNFSAEQLRAVEEAARRSEGGARFVSVQKRVHSLLHREPERDVLPERLEVALIPYFPAGKRVAYGQVPPEDQPAPEGRVASSPEGEIACSRIGTLPL